MLIICYEQQQQQQQLKQPPKQQQQQPALQRAAGETPQSRQVLCTPTTTPLRQNQ